MMIGATLESQFTLQAYCQAAPNDPYKEKSRTDTNPAAVISFGGRKSEDRFACFSHNMRRTIDGAQPSRKVGWLGNLPIGLSN